MRTISTFGRAIIAVGVIGLVAPALASAAASDGWITTKTKIALLTSKGVSSNAINVDTVDGAVTLHGIVSSAEEKAKAEEEAKQVDGVKSVRNLLQVVPTRQAKAVKASDAQLKDRVTRALKSDHSLDDSSIAVQSVNDGIVLLGGTATTAGDHLRALQDARAVAGVQHVATEVKSPDALADEEIRRDSGSKTSGAKRPVTGATHDAWITTDTKTRLFADSRTPALDINVDTWDGVVTLWGNVPSKEAKAAAEADAHKVDGVKRVMNELQVVPSARKEDVKARDEDLKTSVTQALEARDLKSVSVDVKNGVARLTGTVDSAQESLDAAIVARSTAGVRAVANDLRINTASR